MRLILARHGQSYGNVDPEKYKGIDAPLTPLGEGQADNLGKWLKRHHAEIDLILASPLKRALQTAQIVNQYLQIPLQIIEDLSEIPVYDLPRLDQRLHPAKPDLIRESAEDYRAYTQQSERVYNLLLGYLGREKPILVVSHGGAMGTLMRLILERHDIYFQTNNTGLNFLNWENGNWKFAGMNHLQHLTSEMIT